jgi:hypothetical protein
LALPIVHWARHTWAEHVYALGQSASNWHSEAQTPCRHAVKIGHWSSVAHVWAPPGPVQAPAVHVCADWFGVRAGHAVPTGTSIDCSLGSHVNDASPDSNVPPGFVQGSQQSMVGFRWRPLGAAHTLFVHVKPVAQLGAPPSASAMQPHPCEPRLHETHTFCVESQRAPGSHVPFE